MIHDHVVLDFGGRLTVGKQRVPLRELGRVQQTIQLPVLVDGVVDDDAPSDDIAVRVVAESGGDLDLFLGPVSLAPLAVCSAPMGGPLFA